MSYRAPDGGRLAALSASSVRFCCAVGSGGATASGFIARTVDSGRHWRAQAAVSRQSLDGVSFPDQRHGWAVGPEGTILMTADGGATWAPQQTANRYGLTQVSFSDRRHGWALIGHLALLCTADGGQSWSVVRPADTRDVLTGLATVDATSATAQ